jgi:hypothetical protein
MDLGTYDTFLSKYDVNGNVLWAKRAGGSDYDAGVSIAVDASGNAFVTGYFNFSPINFGKDTLVCAGELDIFLAKLASGSLEITKFNELLNFLVYPNPVTEKLTLEFSVEKPEIEYEILNIEGRGLLKGIIKESSRTIDVSTLENGVYKLKVKGEKTIQVTKFIKKL